eukprot:EG_transcript_1918
MCPTALVEQLYAEWQRPGNHDLWPTVVSQLLSFISTVLSSNTIRLGGTQLALAQSDADDIQDRLCQFQSTTQRGSQPRSSDGITQADLGVFPLFEDCTLCSLEEALEGMELEQHGTDFWMCDFCKHPTSEAYEVHMQAKHPAEPLRSPQALRTPDVLRVLRETGSAFPACTLYSMESPVYLASNRSMRDWATDPSQFQVWKRFAFLLDFELQQLERFRGNAYRAIDFRVPLGLYEPGNVVTWNQPSSASSDPRVARGFLRAHTAGTPHGTIFILEAQTARPISQYSLFPNEKEVLFPAGTQFQVLRHTEAGMKELLQSVMRCNLSDVDVLEVRELLLDSWLDLPYYIPPPDRRRNDALVDFVRSLPTHKGVVRAEVKDLSDPMTKLVWRQEDRASPLHLAVQVPNNLPCLQLVCARLDARAFLHQDLAGRTALDVAIELRHEDAAVFLMQRCPAWRQLERAVLLEVLPWVAHYGTDDFALEVVQCASAAPPPLPVPARPQSIQQAFHIAARHNRPRLLEALLAAQADPHQPDGAHGGRTALIACAARGHVEGLMLLLRHKGDIDQADSAGWTALMHAAARGHLPVLQTLLQARADVEASVSPASPSTPLTATTSAAVLSELLQQLRTGAHTAHLQCDDAEDALREDFLQGQQLLRQRKQQPLHPTPGGTPLMLAAQGGHLDAVALLLVAKADVERCRSDKATALMVAAFSGQLAVLRRLLDAKADVNAVGGHGMPVLSYAAGYGHGAIVKTLLQCHADPHQVDDEGTPPMLFAAAGGSVACVQALLGAKADANARRCCGGTALMWASSFGQAATAQVLLQMGADPNGGDPGPLLPAVLLDQPATLQALLAGKADPDRGRTDGLTPLMLAVGLGNGPAVAALLAAGADPNCDCGRWRTPLAMAARHGATGLIAQLLAANADPLARGPDGLSAVAVADRHGQVDAIHLLTHSMPDPP